MNRVFSYIFSILQKIFPFDLKPISRTQDLGRAGELEAERFLKNAGLSIVDRNVRVGKFEIDLIAKDGDEIIFVEVKTRRSDKWGYPEGSVDYKKQKALKKAGRYYFLKHCNQKQTYRFDIIAITCEPTISIEWIKNAF